MQALEELQRLGLQRNIDWPEKLRGELKGLLELGVVILGIPPGKRSPHIKVADIVRLQARIDALKGDALAENASVRATNLGTRGNSKLGHKLPYMLINVLGGSRTTWLKPSGRSLLHATDDCGSYQGIVLNDDSEDDYEPVGDVILIENRDVWLNIRPLLPSRLTNAALIQYEGWLSDRLTSRLSQWKAANIYLLADYDPVGFQNHLRLQSVRPDAHMLIPKMSDAQLDQWGNAEVWQKSIKHLYTLNLWAADCVSEVAQFYQRIARKGLAIEQEALLGIKGLEWQEMAGLHDEQPAGDDQALRADETHQGRKLESSPAQKA